MSVNIVVGKGEDGESVVDAAPVVILAEARKEIVEALGAIFTVSEHFN